MPAPRPRASRRRRHPPHPPRAGIALAPDEADRHELVALEGAERDRAGRLVGRQLLDRHVRAQHGLAQRAGLLERDGADGELGHGLRRVRRGGASLGAWAAPASGRAPRHSSGLLVLDRPAPRAVAGRRPHRPAAAAPDHRAVARRRRCRLGRPDGVPPRQAAHVERPARARRRAAAGPVHRRVPSLRGASVAASATHLAVMPARARPRARVAAAGRPARGRRSRP